MEATQESTCLSGNAAGQRPASRAAGQEGALRQGAAAFQRLLADLSAMSSGTDLHANGTDGNDYVAFAAAVELSIRENVLGVSAQRREGYLRVLTYLLSVAADGGAADDPLYSLEATAAAFDARDELRADAISQLL